MSDKLDNIFRDRFANWEATPPPDAWGNIAAQIGQAPAFPLWLWAGRAAAAVFIALMVFVFPVNEEIRITGNGELAGFVQPTGDSEKGVSALEEPVQTQPASIENSEKAMANGSSTASAQKPGSETVSKMPEEEDLAVNYSIEKPKSKTSSQLKFMNPDGGSPERPSKGEITPSEEKSSIALAGSEQEAELREDIALLDGLSRNLLTDDIEGVLSLDKLETTSSTPELPDERGTKWNWGLTGNVFSTFVVVTPDTNDETIIASPEKSDFQTDRIGWAAGLTAAKQISEHLSLSLNTSFQSLRVGNAFNHHSAIPDQYRFNPASATIEATSTVHQTYASVRYSMIGTEVGLVYWLSNHGMRKGLGFSAGLNRIFQQAYKVGDAGWQKDNLNNWVGSLSISLPMQKAQNRSLLEWTPYVRYNIGNLPHPTGLFQWTPYSVGLKATIMTKR